MACAAPIELKAVAVSDQRNEEPDDITQKSKCKYLFYVQVSFNEALTVALN